jgi:ABC-type multidrug transport system ATPase subunit
MIETSGLTKRYAGVPALDGLDLHIEAGGTIGLVGPNGAGKTTLYSLLAGYLRPDSGSVRLFGMEPGDHALCGRVSILPQDAPLRKAVSVRRQFRFLARLQGMTSAQAADDVERVLAATGISDVAGKAPEHLSHGLFKRAAIAQALLGSPELVLLDEPTAGLDPVAAREVHRLIREAGQQRTIMLSSHNLGEIQDLCQSIVLLDKGKLVRHATLDDLVERLQYLSVTLSGSPPADLTDWLIELNGVVGVHLGKSGDNRIVIEFDSDNADAFQLRLLEYFSRRNIGIVNFSRGKNLADSVVEMMAGA